MMKLLPVIEDVLSRAPLSEPVYALASHGLARSDRRDITPDEFAALLQISLATDETWKNYCGWKHPNQRRVILAAELLGQSWYEHSIGGGTLYPTGVLALVEDQYCVQLCGEPSYRGVVKQWFESPATIRLADIANKITAIRDHVSTERPVMPGRRQREWDEHMTRLQSDLQTLTASAD